MKEFVSGLLRSIGLLLIVCSFCVATTGALADVVMVPGHDCIAGGNPPNGCTCSGDCSAAGFHWPCICGVVPQKNRATACWCGCIAAGSAC